MPGPVAATAGTMIHEVARYLNASSTAALTFNALPCWSDRSRLDEDVLGLKRSQCGTVTFVQRFGLDAKLKWHFHSLTASELY